MIVRNNYNYRNRYTYPQKIKFRKSQNTAGIIIFCFFLSMIFILVILSKISDGLLYITNDTFVLLIGSIPFTIFSSIAFKQYVRMKKINNKYLKYSIFIILIFTVTALFIRNIARNNECSVFQPYIRELLDRTTSVSEPELKRHINGKILIINKDKIEYDDSNWEIPSKLRASTVNEIKTIIIVSYGKSFIGTYSSGDQAYQGYCHITIFDMDKKTFFNERIEGEKPPQTKSGRGTWNGNPPSPANYIMSL